jgi:hypothetical protein
MKKITLLAICIMFCYCPWSNATGDIDGARKFINEFLGAEFSGIPSFRVDNAIYSPERKLWVKKTYGSMIGEIFQLESNQICVVDSYKIIDIKIINSKAIVDVEFQEFARTGRKGYGRTPLIKTEKRTLVTYSLEYKKGRWWINDPPIPRVSRKAVVEHNEEIIKRMSEWVLEKGSEVQKEGYYNLINTNAMLKEKCEKGEHP